MQSNLPNVDDKSTPAPEHILWRWREPKFWQEHVLQCCRRRNSLPAFKEDELTSCGFLSCSIKWCMATVTPTAKIPLTGVFCSLIKSLGPSRAIERSSASSGKKNRGLPKALARTFEYTHARTHANKEVRITFLSSASFCYEAEWGLPFPQRPCFSVNLNISEHVETSDRAHIVSSQRARVCTCACARVISYLTSWSIESRSAMEYRVLPASVLDTSLESASRNRAEGARKGSRRHHIQQDTN